MSNPIITLPATIVPAPLTTPDPAPILLTATLVREWRVDLGRGEGPLVESTVSGHYDAASKNDGGGHKFISDREMQGGSNDSWANLWRYVQGAPAPQAYWQVLPPPDSEGVGYKLDSVSMCPNANGAVEIWMNAHQIKSGPRKSCLAFAVVPDAGWVVGPHSDLEDAGAPFDLSGLGGGGAPDPGLSDAQIVADDLEALRQAVGAGRVADIFSQIQKAAKNGTLQAVGANLLTRDNLTAAWMAAMLDDAARAELDSIIGTQVVKNLVAYGVVAPSAVPLTGPYSWPRGLSGWPFGAHESTAGPTGEPGGIQMPAPGQ